MKRNKLLLTIGFGSMSLLPLAIVSSCSSNQDSTTTDPLDVISAEIKRIEKISENFQLKKDQPITNDFINSLNEDNILDYIEGWEVGNLDQTNEKFNYQIQEFDNGLKSQLDAKNKILSFKINVSYQEKSQVTNLIKIKYQLVDQVPDFSPDQLLNPDGGKLLNTTNLVTSGYKNLLDTLGIFKDNTYLPKITNDLLKSKLSENEKLKKFVLTINEESNTLNGKLVLNLTEKNNNQKINAKIIISNFSAYPVDNNIALNYQLLKVNIEKWFDLKLPILGAKNLETEIKNITSEQWNQLLDNFQVFENDTNHFGQASEMKLNGFTFEINSTWDGGKNQIKLNIVTKFKHFKYENNQWVTSNQTTIWNQASNKPTFLDIYTRDQLQQLIIDKTEVNETELSTKIPSYYLGRQNYFQAINSPSNIDDDLFTNQYLEDQDFVSKYFGTQRLNIIFLANSVRVNDWTNYLDFSIGLLLDDQIVKGQKEFSFENKNKSIKEVLKAKLTKNNVQILNDSKLKDNIVNHLKKTHKSEVDNLFQAAENTTINFNDLSKLLIQEILRRPLLNYESPDTTEANWTKIEKLIQPTIFDKSNPITIDRNPSIAFEGQDHLNLASQLYTINQTDQFVLENFVYQFKDNIELILTKQPQIIKVELKAETLLYFAGGHEEIIPTTFYFNIHPSDWTKN